MDWIIHSVQKFIWRLAGNSHSLLVAGMVIYNAILVAKRVMVVLGVLYLPASLYLTAQGIEKGSLQMLIFAGPLCVAAWTLLKHVTERLADHLEYNLTWWRGQYRYQVARIESFLLSGDTFRADTDRLILAACQQTHAQLYDASIAIKQGGLAPFVAFRQVNPFTAFSLYAKVWKDNGVARAENIYEIFQYLEGRVISRPHKEQS